MLNRDRPHEQVYGMQGVHWMQNGVLFNYAGHPVDEAGNRCEMPQPALTPLKTELGSMSDRMLAVMLGQYGEVFTTREKAIEMLCGAVTT